MQPATFLRTCAILGVSAAATISACGTTEPKLRPTDIVVTAIDTLRSIGATATVSGVVRDQKQQVMPDQLVTSWTSANAAVATVTSAGLVTATGNGVTTITAHSGSATGSIVVVVQQRPAAMTLSAPTDTLRSLGITAQYTATVKDSAGVTITPAAVQWSSSDGAIVGINAGSGLATSIANGSAYVRAQAGNVIDSVPLAVRQRIDASKSTVSVLRPLLFVSDTVRVTLRGRDANARPMAFGGSTVAFIALGGSSTGTVFPTVDQGDGTYTADFVGTAMGTEKTVGATIDGTAVSTASPTLRVVGFTKVVAYSGNFANTCGIVTTGELYCWGSRDGGVRGDGVSPPTGPEPTPSLVAGSHQWTDVTLGLLFGCGIAESSKLYCWGSASNGNLGNGTGTGNFLTPIAIVPESSFVSVHGGLGSAPCAITLAHTAMCWGSGVWGRLGNGADTTVLQPVSVSGGQHFSSVAPTYAGACGITDAGAAMCWGYYSTLGMGSGPYPDVCAGPVDCSKTPVAVIGGHTFKPGNTLDGNKACAIATDDITYCWGASPSAVSGAPTFTSIAAGDLDYCGIVQNGDVYCWGTNRNGRFGQPPDQTQIHSVPELQASGHAFVRISMAQEHMCGLVNDGNAWCWGKNAHGQLGDRTTTPSSTPVRVRLYAP